MRPFVRPAQRVALTKSARSTLTIKLLVISAIPDVISHFHDASSAPSRACLIVCARASMSMSMFLAVWTLRTVYCLCGRGCAVPL